MQECNLCLGHLPTYFRKLLRIVLSRQCDRPHRNRKKGLLHVSAMYCLWCYIQYLCRQKYRHSRQLLLSYHYPTADTLIERPHSKHSNLYSRPKAVQWQSILPSHSWLEIPKKQCRNNVEWWLHKEHLMPLCCSIPWSNKEERHLYPHHSCRNCPYKAIPLQHRKAF